MNNKLALKTPLMILLYGFPGAGKTFLARNLAQEIKAAHVQSDKIKSMLFGNSQEGQRETEIASQISEYMAQEFLSTGNSVVYDGDASRFKKRRQLRDMARASKAKTLLIWVQIDLNTAYTRGSNRNPKRTDDQYKANIDRPIFDSFISSMQNPNKFEEYIVLSGKHTYKMIRQVLIKKMLEMGLIDYSSIDQRLAKPTLVNLIPNHRPDEPRRNIVIR